MKALYRQTIFATGAALAVLCAASTPLQAQQSAATDEPEPPRVYQVELIVFRHLDQSRTTSEIPRMPEPTIEDILELDLARIEGSSGNELPDAATDLPAAPLEADATAESEPAHWRQLGADELLLADIQERLTTVEAYEMLAHLGWLQHAPEVTEAVDIPLEALGLDTLVATGNVNLYKKRYLHIAIEVALADDAAGESNPFGDAFQVFAAPRAVPAVADSRRVRLEKLLYFDQPQFGVIAMVARSEQQLLAEDKAPPISRRYADR